MKRRTCLSVEALEDRCLPSFYWGGEYTLDTLPGYFDETQASLTADFNADGVNDRFDVTIPGMGDFGAFGTVYLGREDGTFYEWQSFGVGMEPRLIGVGEANGDGRPDLMVYNYYDEFDQPVYLFLNDGIWPNTPQLSISGASVTEGNSGTVEAVFTVTLANGPDQPVTVQYATSDESATASADYQATSGTLTFEPGETTKSITVAVNGDRLAEGNESFLVNLSDPTNALLASDQGRGMILDDEPSLSISDATVTEGNTGTRSATFTVTLSAAYDMPVAVDYATADGTATAGNDYQAASSTLTFAPGEVSKTVTVSINGDRVAESNETFSVNLSAPTSASIGDGQGVGTIIDDEPRVSINNVSMKEGNGGTHAFTFTVTLAAAYDVPVTIKYATADGTAKTSDDDYVANSGTITFAPGQTTKTITIVVKGDKKKEANENFFVDLSDLSSYAVFLDPQGMGTIQNDD